MKAAKNAGCKGVLIDAHYNKEVNGFKRADDMQDAVDIILNNRISFP